MRYYTLIFLFISVTAYAQQTHIFRIDSLPTEGVLLNKNWKFQTGDNPDFAKPDFDDSAWADIDPTKDIMALPGIVNAQIKWLRLHVEVTNKQPNLLLGLAINQAGASEIYLNGRLIHQIGHIGTDSNKTKAHDPLEYPVYFPADSVGHYHLAVRYALQPNIRYTQIFRQTKNRLFNATLVDLLSTLNSKRAFNRYYLGLEIFCIGILSMLLILHSIFYFFQRINKTHLLLAIYIMGIMAVRILKLIGETQFSVEYRYYSLNIANCLLAMSVVCLARVYYRIAKVNLDNYYYSFIGFQCIYALISVFNYGFPWQSILLLIGTIYGFFLSTRLTRIGLKKEIKGFLMLSIGIMISVLGLLCRVIAALFLNYGVSPLGYNTLNYGVSPYLIDLIIILGALAIPISLSIFMGIEGNEVNKSLSKQLLENDRLKNKAVEQEREKQQMLASQNETLEKQVAERTAALEQSLETLKATQNQLIQQEKLASLGELTAGIAHEIQNPLNFVNNFAELSIDLVKDIREEWDKTDKDEDYIEELFTDLSQNQQKINHHGKRASSIVKAMLEHSHASSGEYRLTDVNTLADEYLRLSYHGLRAKDKTFNADFRTDFDENLPKTILISQDIGRVLLNLFNNAFYAVHQKKQQLSDSLTLLGNAAQQYTPSVFVATKQSDNHIIISVRDNGGGIPEDVAQKIFQPFFTTKPTGEGTGLGLSLSYEIVTKGHGGSLTVENTEGVGACFVVRLPIKTP